MRGTRKSHPGCPSLFRDLRAPSCSGLASTLRQQCPCGLPGRQAHSDGLVSIAVRTMPPAGGSCFPLMAPSAGCEKGVGTVL